jgi:phospholipid-binding lipoprotein MlaA
MTRFDAAVQRRRTRAACGIALVALALAGCASTPSGQDGEAPRRKNPDPLEGFNRGVYRFNDAIDRKALRPVAVAYRDHTPRWLQQGVGNFFTNLFYPTTILHQFLQGKLEEGSQDVARFVINTTLGWGGIFDVASGAKLPIHDEDSGQTLGRWGVPPGPYLMLPLLGPATLRDAPARYVDDFSQPFRWYDAEAERWISLAVYTVHRRSELLQADRFVQQAYDPYVFLRDAYLQRRQFAVYDGDPPEEAIEDDDDWAEEALREDEAALEEEAAAAEDDGARPDEAGTAPDTTREAEEDDGSGQ